MSRSGGAAKMRVRQSAIEALEKRVLLSSAIAAFGAQHTFSAGPVPRSATVADVNLDGKPDLLVVDRDSDTLGVLLGNGDGTFAAQRTAPTGPKPYSLAVADVNGDGKPDVLVANYAYTHGSLTVLLGNGDGTFRLRSPFPAGYGAYTVVTADFNGDGKIDAAVTNYSANTVSIVEGFGNSTFAFPLTQAVGAHPSGLATADINGDGKADLVTTNYTDGTVSFLLGNGNGTFQPHSDLPAGANPNSLAIGDINGDGKPDIAVANFTTSGQINLLLGNGNGTFLPAQSFGAASQPSAIAIADINRDGKLDLALAAFGVNEAAVFLGNGNATFQPQKLFATGTFPDSVAVADLNLDGRPDLALANMNGSTVSVLLGDLPPSVVSISRLDPIGPITSASQVDYSVQFNEPVFGLDPTDFNITDSDGILADRTLPVSISGGGGSAYVVTMQTVGVRSTFRLNLVDDGSIHDAAGNPLQSEDIVSFSPRMTLLSGYAGAFGAGDINGDGKPDLALKVGVGSSSGVGVLLGNGDGTFAPLSTFADAVHRPSSGAIADVNLDGKPDLVITDLQRYGAVEVLLGNGDGTFASRGEFSTGSYPGSVQVADMNGDGKPDVVVANDGNGGILLGNGDGTFAPQKTFGQNTLIRAVGVGDFNGDGKPDVAFCSRLNGNAGVLLGNGDGTFGAALTVAGLGPLDVRVADFNGDGKLDLAVANFTSSGVNNNAGIYLGNGNGTFQRQQTFFTSRSSSSLIAVDMSGDGKVDLVVADSSNSTPPGDTISVLTGNGDGTFKSQQTYAIPFVGGFLAADFDRDGKPDLEATGPSLAAPVNLFMARPDGSSAGDLYYYVPPTEVANGGSGNDQFTLTQYENGSDIQWTIHSPTIGFIQAQLPINDPLGLTINGNGGNDIIYLNYTNGSPLPRWLHLNGSFTVQFLGGTSLAGSNIDIGKSTVYFSYPSGASPLSAIQQALTSGYNGGAWNGVATDSTGVITSAAAASTPHTAIGYADSADGTGVNTTPNSIELKYTLVGDLNLDGAVNITDVNALVPQYNSTGNWTAGDFNYDGLVNITDVNALVPNYNQSLPAAAPSGAGQVSAAAVNASSTSSDSSVSGSEGQSVLQGTTDARKLRRVRRLRL